MDCRVSLIQGAKLVRLARSKNIPIQVYPGPSSIIQALMLSGFSGQAFAFHGYLPRDEKRLSFKIKDLVKAIRKDKQTQIFIEAPYRNNRLVNALNTLVPKDISKLAATDLMLDSQVIHDLSTHPDLHKKPSVFLLGV